MDNTNKMNDEYYVIAVRLWMVLAVILEKNQEGMLLTHTKFDGAILTFLWISIFQQVVGRGWHRDQWSAPPPGSQALPRYRRNSQVSNILACFLRDIHSSLSTNAHSLSGIIFLETLQANLALHHSVAGSHLRLSGCSSSPRLVSERSVYPFCWCHLSSFLRSQTSYPTLLEFNVWTGNTLLPEAPFTILALPEGHCSLCSPL